jgi:hypothetical protein
VFKTGTRRFVAVAIVLASTAAVLPDQPYGVGPVAVDPYEVCRALFAEYGEVSCAVTYVTESEAPEPTPARVPQPTALATDGVPGCVRGAGRPVVGTTKPSLSASFAVTGWALLEATFEREPLDGSEDPVTSTVSGPAGEPAVLPADENGLAPGVSYRWRVRGTPFGAAVPGWSEWCEFTVAAGLVDLRAATDVPAVQELGVVPSRRYPVTLTVRQWRLFLDALEPWGDAAGAVNEANPIRTGGGSAAAGSDNEGDGVVGGDLSNDEAQAAREGLRRISADVRARIGGKPAGRRVAVTLTGDRWASAASELAAEAFARDESYAEEPDGDSDGSAFWKLLDRISTQLGGPAHPHLQYDR